MLKIKLVPTDRQTDRQTDRRTHTHTHTPVVWASPPISTFSMCSEAPKFGCRRQKRHNSELGSVHWTDWLTGSCIVPWTGSLISGCGTALRNSPVNETSPVGRIRQNMRWAEEQDEATRGSVRITPGSSFKATQLTPPPLKPPIPSNTLPRPSVSLRT